MSNEKQTIYAGNGRQINSQYGTFRSVSICLSDLPKEHMTKGKNGKTYISLNVNDKEQKDQYGNDVAVTVNTWKPDSNQQSHQAPQAASNSNQDINELPF